MDGARHHQAVGAGACTWGGGACLALRPMKRKRPKRRTWLIAALAAVAIAAVATWWIRGDFDWREVTARIAAFDPAVVFVLMATLPIVGFSVSVTYLVAGLKFGPVLGGVAVAGATAVHLLATYWICQTVLRGRIERMLKRRGHELPHVPEGENISVAAMAVLVPGLPYVARNMLLALTDVPLRVYFWICLPLYVARSYVTILLGDLGMEPDRRTFVILAAVYVVKLSVCAYLIWRIRRRIKERKRAEVSNPRMEPRSASA